MSKLAELAGVWSVAIALFLAAVLVLTVFDWLADAFCPRRVPTDDVDYLVRRRKRATKDADRDERILSIHRTTESYPPQRENWDDGEYPHGI